MKNTLIAAAALLTLVYGCGSDITGTDIPNTPVVMEDLGAYYAIGGDQLLDKRDPAHQKIIAYLKGDTSRAVARVGVPLWPDGIMPYYIDNAGEGGAFTEHEKQQIYRALHILSTNANLTFVEKDQPGEYVYRLHKVNNPNIGGYSTVGYSLYANYGFRSSNISTIMHEFMHGLGFWHEHQRFDRDAYVRINWENIMSGYGHNFSIIPELDYEGRKHAEIYGSYGFDSIMHYPVYGFSVNGRPCIEAHDPSVNISRHPLLAESDRAGLTALYGEPKKADTVYQQMYIRGSFNNWQSSAMTLKDGIWEAAVSFNGSGEFKFDVHGDWSLNYGASTSPGIAVRNGANMQAPAGQNSIIRFNDQSKEYSITAEQNTKTIIRVHYNTGMGNYLVIRGDLEAILLGANFTWRTNYWLTWSEGNVWYWETEDIPAGAHFEFKALLNNDKWQTGANSQGTGGSIINVYPSF